jgi:prophage regulatory protein
MGCDGCAALQLIWPILFHHLKAISVGRRAHREKQFKRHQSAGRSPPLAGSHIREIKNLRLPAVLQLPGLSHSTIYVKVADGSFPKQISLGTRAAGWRERDVSAWLENLTEKSSATLLTGALILPTLVGYTHLSRSNEFAATVATRGVTGTTTGTDVFKAGCDEEMRPAK